MTFAVTKCTKGDDKTCTDLYGTMSNDACCAYFKMVDMPSTLTSEQTAALALLEAIGYPNEKGESTHICMPSAAAMKAQFGEKDEETQNGFTIKGYCDASSMLMASVATFVGTMMAANY